MNIYTGQEIADPLKFQQMMILKLILPLPSMCAGSSQVPSVQGSEALKEDMTYQFSSTGTGMPIQLQLT